MKYQYVHETESNMKEAVLLAERGTMLPKRFTLDLESNIVDRDKGVDSNNALKTRDLENWLV